MQRNPLPSPEEIAALPPDGGERFNRLIHSTSPYLLQHAANPVDWHPWGPEAFTEAKRRDVPVFVSIGYAACHWCHVMEHESFENGQVAQALRRGYVAVKVDREERPDIDDAMMLVTQAFTGRGGWPNSLWLTPDGRPWYAGTYFPRDDHAGRIGFLSLLDRLSRIWREQRDEVENQASRMARSLGQYAATTPGPAPLLESASAPEYLRRAVHALHQTFDAREGGFGNAPKFPPHAALLFLVRRLPDETAKAMLTRTLDAMMLGGIHDQVGGGFHRYATDGRWFLPHYEKMLYDNALLARAYAEAGTAHGDADYLTTAERTCDWVLRDLRLPNGLFASSLDADTEQGEGETYLWTRDEIHAVLGPERGETFCRLFQCTAEGNAHDEATGKPTGKNLPHLAARIPEKDRAAIEAMRNELLDARAGHPAPGRDDKAVAAWNGMMIGALAVTGRAAGRKDFLDAAEAAAAAVREHLEHDPDHPPENLMDGGAAVPPGVSARLVRSWRHVPGTAPGFLEDYAAMAWGLAELHTATGDPSHRDRALSFLRALDERFRDETGAYQPVAADHETLFVSTLDTLDQATPAGNGVAALAWTTLAGAGVAEAADRAWRLLDARSGWMHHLPAGTLSHHAALAGLPAPDVQPVPVGESRWRKPPVTLTARPEPGVFPLRSEVRLIVELRFDEGWYAQEGSPVSLDLGCPRGLRETGRTDTATGHGTRFVLTLSVDHTAPLGSADLQLALGYVACGHDRCLPRENLDIKVPIALADPAQPPAHPGS